MKRIPFVGVLALLVVTAVVPATAQSSKEHIWRSAGRVNRLDLANGPGGRAGAPKPPFTFVEEDTGGTNPKIEVRDAAGRIWGVKWGTEVNSEVFASRIVWAAGYFVEPSYFVPNGKVVGVTKLDRAKEHVAADGSFVNARFELKDKNVLKLKDEESWRWDVNPFVGSKELDGLKVVMMLLSNWDSKDQRDAGRGSNTKIFQVKTRTGAERHYVVSDWGGTMGKWGGVLRREKWDADGFMDQSDDFIKGVKNGMVEFGYSGQHTESIKDGIPVEHVRWIASVLAQLSDAQIESALKASGASTSETQTFATALRVRLNRMKGL
jgi:hypothetical protein